MRCGMAGLSMIRHYDWPLIPYAILCRTTAKRRALFPQLASEAIVLWLRASLKDIGDAQREARKIIYADEPSQSGLINTVSAKLIRFSRHKKGAEAPFDLQPDFKLEQFLIFCGLHQSIPSILIRTTKLLPGQALH